ncbi:MAG TPA: metalloregulator ArsR/SmtB family transcription factor [Bacillota bacterium]|nr:metalloregulator ArsR/SmtB family transcription factor [Bacillota bacterium]
MKTTPMRVDDDACDAVLVHGEQVARLRGRLPDADSLQAEAERFRALGDPTRLKMLMALAMSELCVCDIAALADVTQTCASQHLRVLRAHGLVRFRKQGRMAVYRLADPWVAAALGTEAAARARKSG